MHFKSCTRRRFLKAQLIKLETIFYDFKRKLNFNRPSVAGAVLQLDGVGPVDIYIYIYIFFYIKNM